MQVSDARIREAILALVAARGPDRTCCPSEIARHLAPDAWRGLMAPVRAVAVGLAHRGELVITRRGMPVALDAPLRGAVRLRQAVK